MRRARSWRAGGTRWALTRLCCVVAGLGTGCVHGAAGAAPALAASAASPSRAGPPSASARGRGGASSAAASSVPRAGAALVSLDVEGAPLPIVLDALARQAGWNVACDPTVNARVTLRLREVPWPVALALLLEQARCEATPLTPRLLLVTQPPYVSLGAGGLSVSHGGG